MVGEKRFKFDQMILAGIIHTGVHPCQRFGFGNIEALYRLQLAKIFFFIRNNNIFSHNNE